MLKALVISTTLKKQCFQAIGFKYKPAPLQLGRAWTVELAGRALKISIEDEHPCTIEEAMRMVELVPEQYLRGLEIVSEVRGGGVWGSSTYF